MRERAESVTWCVVDSFDGNTDTPTLTEERACPVCQSVRARPLVVLADFQFFTDSASVPKRLDIQQVQCRDCFALAMSPCYSEVGFDALFADASQSYGATEGRHEETLNWLVERGLLAAGNSALDVGCYDGVFLEKMPQSVKKLGVDIDATAIARGRERLLGHDVELVQADFEHLEIDQRLDTITMFHVLEHLARPIPVLQKLRSLSHRSTKLVVEVPIVEGGQTNDLVGFFSAAHLTHFSRRSLENCLKQSGWQAIEWASLPDYNGWRVVATPSDRVRDISGDPADISHAARVIASWQLAAVAVMDALQPAIGEERCVIWCAGLHTEYLYQRTSLFQDSHRRYFLVDNDPGKHGKTWRGLPIYSPAILKDLDLGTTPIVVSTYGSQGEVAHEAMALGLENVITLYDEVHVR